MRIQLGQEVKDHITGFSGVVTGISEYLYGCRQMLVVSRKLKEDGETVSKWLDEQRLGLVSGEKTEPRATSGGHQDHPPARN